MIYFLAGCLYLLFQLVVCGTLYYHLNEFEPFEEGWRSLKKGCYVGYKWRPGPDARHLGLEHIYYDGDFYSLGLWFVNLCWINNPHCYLTDAEIRANLEAFYQANPQHRPKENK